ncbi:helix-turn-helix transcriptional regulator [Tumebacillus permanentifrigoris]|uniref:DNA-binding XRE family transcriptional regulator n=1 Tax=Tumebacillus permanentifrigoris TaxID=378543 RepID=A0A316DAZ0_9BACL|nr:helix-turn-helix transcriptional regulator [Tumebacillus permanentifrigoris]PWK14498.1 DNA-binding XRE family transcriptional regulator [Tumebacillus permanentifrigoris]
MLLDSTLTIGQRFKQIRNAQGYSQASLAEGICSISVISHMETDRYYPSATMLGKLADKLGLPLREIMGMQEQQMEAGFQIDIVRVYVEKCDFHHALALIDEIDQRADLLDHQRVELLINRVDCCIKIKKSETAVEILLPFLEQQESSQTIEDESLCTLYNKLGNAYYRQTEYEKSFSAYERAYTLSLKFPQLNLLGARVLFNMGLICGKLGFKSDAMRYLESAHQFFQSISDMESVANTLFALAVETEDPTQLLQARSLYESLNLLHEANRVKQLYAYKIESKNDYKKSIQKLRAIAADFETFGDLGRSVISLARALLVCLEHEDLEEAGICYQEAARQVQKMDVEDTFVLGYFYRSKSQYSLKMKDFENSIVNAQRSSEICAKMGLYADSAKSLQICAKAFESQGNHQQAYEVSNKALEQLLHRGGHVE